MLRIVALVVACLQLVACTVSRVPITSANGDHAEPALVGTWRFTFWNETSEGTIRTDDAGQLIFGFTDKNGTKAENSLILLARIGTATYASLTVTKEHEAARTGYFVARYEVEDPDRVVIYAPNISKLLDAIERKLVTGRDMEDRHMPMVELTASADELRAFVEQHGTRVFDQQVLVLYRVKDPSPR